MDIPIGFALFALAGLALMQLASIARSLRSTEAMLARLLALQGVQDLPTEPSDRVRALASDRRSYVEAIRAYREQTGLGLREAKAVVDRLARPGRHATADRPIAGQDCA